MVMYLKIATLNCNGLRNDAKRALIFDKLRNSNVDVVLLQETFSTPEVEFQWSMAKNAFWNSWHNNARVVAILFCNDQLCFKNTNCDDEARVISLDVVVFGEIFYLANVYAPVGESIRLTLIRKFFFNSIHRYVHQVSHSSRGEILTVWITL